MVNTFLDTNYFIDAVHRKPERKILESLVGSILSISPLSFHIYCYTYKIKIPNQKLLRQKDKFQLIDLSDEIFEQALRGPTRDLEDNIQLHSAAEAECDYFLTNDEELLNMKFFGKMKIASAI